MKKLLFLLTFLGSTTLASNLLAQTTQVSLTNGDGWYRIISDAASVRAGGTVRIYGTSGNNRSTLITMNVSLMRFQQGGSINITDNLFYNSNHVDQIRGGSVSNQELVLDVHFVGISNPSNLWVEVDGISLTVLNTPVFNPTPPNGNVIEISGRIIGTNSTRWPLYFGQNVGIGTETPFQNSGNQGLHIDKGGHSTVLIGDGTNDGGVIQSSDNRQRIFIGSNLYDDPNNSWQNFKPGNSAAVDLIGDMGLIRFSTSSTANGYNASNIRMSILPNGYVGIGTTSPQSKLAVNGQIRATEVKVLADISVPDYVFEADYELRTLKETKEYITENKHLPEIPSAAEIGENGIDLGDMNMRLLKKIEELTLYQIDLMEKLEKQNSRLLEVEKELQSIKN